MATGEPDADERRMLPAPAGASLPDRADGIGRASRAGFALPASSGMAGRIRRAARDAVAVERDRGAGFLSLPVLLAAGAALYWTLPFEPGFPLLGSLVGAAIALRLAAAEGGMARLAATAALMVALGALAGKAETWRASTPMLGAEIPTMVTGRVAAIERQASGRVRLTIDVSATARPTLRHAPRRVRLSARAIPATLVPGDGVSGYARLFPPSGPARPHGYDFAFESYMDGIGATGFFLTNPVETDLPAAAGWRQELLARVGRMREAISARIVERVGGAEGAIAAALIAGTRAGIPEEVNEDLRKTGLAHVLSISGLHMALVAGTVMLTLRFLFALAPGFASRRPVKKYAAVAALLAASYYLVICGAAVAAQRSFIMIAVMLVALLFDRAALTMRNLAISALIVVAVAPHEVVGPSFQMSFAATGALIAAYAAWSERRLRHPPGGGRNHDRALPRALLGKGLAYAGGIAATSLIAGTATALYGVWHFHRASPLGLVANLLAMPVVSLVVMPSAVLAGVLMPFGLDGPALDLMGWGIGVMLAVARRLAELTPIDAVGAIPAAAVLTLTVALVLATVLTTWLRLLALPLLVAGLAIIAGRDLPDLFVSDDGRLVAMRMGNGDLSVSRPRPSDFVTGIWMDAAMAGAVVRPVMTSGGAEQASGVPQPFSPPEPDTPFTCTGGACAARHASGALVVWVSEGVSASGHCGTAALMVIEDATVAAPCPAGSSTTVLTRRDLARRGSAEGRFTAAGEGRGANVALRRAIREPFRPWHAHRSFSREARGMPPYEPERRKPDESSAGAPAGRSPDAPAQ
ncbi:ComEC/Rec2 family competence protein [Aquibium microcysteis]|uniref:ComEC/Rec2 family competence protein n=1 Tax=Aquibium microcysteis TaxID=675281 RepID=UPI00165D184D|nr:ComEC/Rec2 family competence protein [Aquibium microcysteis]